VVDQCRSVLFSRTVAALGSCMVLVRAMNTTESRLAECNHSCVKSVVMNEILIHVSFDLVFEVFVAVFHD
jgi:hypothetical protein